MSPVATNFSAYRPPFLVWAAVIILCLLHIWMAASVSRTFSTTVDELAHLTAGHAYNTTGDYRMQPENGNFPQRWAALPLFFQSVKFPSTTSGNWISANVWPFGHEFFHLSGNDLPKMLAAGRAMNALLSGLLCFSIFLLARNSFGLGAGFIALILAVFSPTLLAHGGLITSDTAACLGFALATLAWSRLLQRITLGRIFWAGAALGLLALSKYSAVLFAPLAILTAMMRVGRSAALRGQLGQKRWRWQGVNKVTAMAVTGGVVCLVAVGFVWSAYGFRYSAAPKDSPPMTTFAQSWEMVLFKSAPTPAMTMADGQPLESINQQPGFIQTTVEWARHYQLLPEAYLYGFAFVARHSRGRLAYFAGEYRLHGWPLFFPTAFAVKTTLSALGLMILGALGVALSSPHRRRVWLHRIAPLIIFLGIYWCFAITSRLNIGHRHLLPVYFASYVLAAGSVLLLLRNRRVYAWLGAVFLLTHIYASLSIRPDYLAYFNPLAGGPENGHRLFVDSSLDWGQDLPRLQDWLELNRDKEPVFLSYFGSGSPVHQGIVATRVGDGYFDQERRITPPTLTSGLYCISATMLHRVYTATRGPWSESYEKSYQTLLSWIRHMDQQTVDGKPTDSNGTPLSSADVNNRLYFYEQLQFGRLCHYLEAREPNHRVGYTFLIYHLSDAEIRFALYAPLQNVNAALKQLSQP